MSALFGGRHSSLLGFNPSRGISEADSRDLAARLPRSKAFSAPKSFRAASSCTPRKRIRTNLRLGICRVYQTLRVTPTLEAGLTDHVWSLEELVSLMPELETKKRDPYEKRALQSWRKSHRRRTRFCRVYSLLHGNRYGGSTRLHSSQVGTTPRSSISEVRLTFCDAWGCNLPFGMGFSKDISTQETTKFNLIH